MLVSIIVLTYNSESTLSETLQSIKEQSYQEIELIISDDHSTDATAKIARKWITANEERFVRCTYIEPPSNTGVSANCNRGFLASHGEMCKLLAGDDKLRSNAIEEYVKASACSNEKVIYMALPSPYSADTKDDGAAKKILDYYRKWLPFFEKSNKEQYKILLKADPILAPAIGLISRKLYQEAGRFDENFPMMEDYPFYLKASRAGYTYRLIDKELVDYRVSADSLCQGGSMKFRRARFDFFIHVRAVGLLENKMFLTFAGQMIRNILAWVRYHRFQA